MKNILLVFMVLVNIVSVVPGASGQSKLKMRVHISPDANNNNPIALDLVLVKDKKLLNELGKMTAAEWFEKRDQLRRDYPKERDLGNRRWEWVPGQVVVINPIPLESKFAGGIIFANYFTPGAHRALINPRKPFVINLGAKDISVALEK